MSEAGKTGTEGEGGAAAAAVVAAPTIALADLKTAGLPDTYFGEDGTLKAQDLTAHLTEYGTLKQQATERAAGVPPDGKYDFSLPKDWKAPEGLKADGFEWNAPEELTARFAERAKAMGLSQKDVSEFVSDWAAGDLAKKTAAAAAEAAAGKADDEAVLAEATKVLGENFKDVIANIRQAGQARLIDLIGKEKGELLAKEISFQSAAGIKAYSDLINALGTHQAPQGTAGAESKNAALVEKIGKPGFTAMDIFNAASQG